jgi:Domain of unknown function (DUF4189)
MKMKLFLLLCLLIFSQACLADNGCPAGYYFTGRMIQGQGISYPECAPEAQQAQQQQQPAAPRGHWETRWGAIAIDGVRGKIGGVTNHKSKQAATKAAIKECYSRGMGGNKDCKIHLVYYNQCATVAWGDDMYTSSGRGSLEESDRDTMQRCSEVTANCKVVYNACSKPEWISY